MRENRVFLLSILGSAAALLWVFAVPRDGADHRLVSPVPDVLYSATVHFDGVPVAGADEVTPPAPPAPAASR